MKRALRFMVVTLLFLSMGISGCVSTVFQTDWKDPAFRGKFNKVLVVCLVKEMVIRNALEDDLVAQFKTRGVDAVQSYKLFPSLENINKEIVRAKVRDIHADGVFLVRIIGKETIDVVTAPVNPNINSNYYNQWGVMSLPALQASAGGMIDRYKVETSLYEAVKGGIVWQALSETYNDNPWTKTVKNFAVIMTQKLSEHGLI